MATVIAKLGDDISTDVIYPGRYMATVLPSETPQFAFADIAELNGRLKAKQVPPGSVIVAGKNFGCGSSREQACSCLKGYELTIVARGFARIFLQNSINLGLNLVTAPEVEASEGDDLELAGERLVNKTTREDVRGRPAAEGAPGDHRRRRADRLHAQARARGRRPDLSPAGSLVKRAGRVVAAGGLAVPGGCRPPRILETWPRPRPRKRSPCSCRPPRPPFPPRLIWAANRFWMETENRKTRRYGGQGPAPLVRAAVPDARRSRSLLKLTRQYERGVRNAWDIAVREIDVALPRLPAAFDGFTILHLSDLHLDGMPGLERRSCSSASAGASSTCAC